MSYTVFLYPDAARDAEYPSGCPFRIARIEQTYQKLRSLALLGGTDRTVVVPPIAKRRELERFHTPEYLDELERASRGELSEQGLHMGLGTDDTPVFPKLWEIACAGAGAALHGTRLLLDDEARRVFSPLGGFHHATADQAAGFCYVNDVVLAAMRFADAGKRVLCLDIDAHHGDGTEKAFYEWPEVMTISLHQDGRTLFPETGFEHEIGSGDGEGYNVNLCFPPDTYDEIYLEAFHAVVPPLLEAFAPDVIVMELGMDTLGGDPLTHMQLTNNAPVEILRWVRDLDLPLLAIGGGGYHVDNTVRAWSRMWEVLCHDEHDEALAFGMGGSLLETTDWRGGLPDRDIHVDAETRARIEPAVRASVEKVKQHVFGRHGI